MNSMAKHRRCVLLPILLCLYLSPSHHSDLPSPSPNQSSKSSLSPPVRIREDAEVSEDHSFPHEKNSSNPPSRTLQSDGTGQRRTPKTPPTPNRKLLQTGFPSFPPLSVAPGGVTCILFRARKMAISHYNHSAVDLTERTFGPSALVDTGDSTCSKDHAVLSLNFGDVEHLKGLVIRLEMSNIFYESTEQTWFTLDSIQILYNHELEAMFDAPEIYAPATHSYHCKHVSSLQKYDSLLVPNKVRPSEGGHGVEEPRNAPSNWHITFTDFQAVMGKDRLSSQIVNMKNMLQGQSEDGISELVALQGDTLTYEAAAKELLHRVLQKMEVCSILTKVELRLSSAQDTCEQMQHLRDRAEQELTEPASEYNTAVKLIKDLTHTVKLAETQQQTQLHKLLQEKRELQQLIQSLEEQKQETQSNRDTKERLTYQQAKLLYGLLQCILEEMAPTQESQMDAAESTVSDTLCSSADPANQSTGRMEEKNETEAMNNITLHTEDCGSGELQRNEAKFQSRDEELKSRETELQAKEVGLQSREAELQSREAQLQSREAQLQSKEADLQSREAEIQSGEALRVLVREAQDQAACSKSRCAELQGELQKNYTVLQSDCAALRSEKTELQENMHRLEKELRSGQDQVALLSRSVGLLEQTQEVLESKLTGQQEQHQQDCARQKAHLEQATQRIKNLQREYEDTQVGLEQMKERCCELEREKQEVLQQCRENLRHMEEKVSQYEDTQFELKQMKQMCSELEQEKVSLSEELQQCKETLKHLQDRANRYEDTQFELKQMKQMCSELEQEKVSLSEELQQCKETLKHLQDRANRPSLLPVLGMLVGVVLAVLYWGYSSLW